MRLRLLVSLALVLALLGGADVAARGYAEGKIRERAEAAVPGARAQAEITSFPFVLRLLTSGSVTRLRLRLSPVRTSQLELADVAMTIEGLRLDRDRLLSGKVEPVGIRSGTVTFEVTEASLTSAVGRRVTIEAGRAFVDVGGRDLEAQVTTTARAIRLEVAGLPVSSIALDRHDVVPCRPDVRLGVGALTLSCRFDRLPPALARAASRAP